MRNSNAPVRGSGTLKPGFHPAFKREALVDGIARAS
jgi:hypothetical protein